MNQALRSSGGSGHMVDLKHRSLISFTEFRRVEQLSPDNLSDWRCAVQPDELESPLIEARDH